MTIFHAAVLGVLQGVTELFPISSLGHSVILPGLLHWQLNEQAPQFLVFLVATHLATALVLLFIYRRDWAQVVAGLVRSLRERRIRPGDTYAKLGWLLVVSTVPAGLLGLLFEKQIREIFISPLWAALFLAGNGLLLFAAEGLRKRSVHSEGDPDARIALLSWRKGLSIGTMQALALLPGFSRTGASLAGGLRAGLSHLDALRFSFLLATPIIGAAAALKLPALFRADTATLWITLVGACVSAAAAYVSVRFLTRYFEAKQHTLTPFAWYCLLVGVGALLYLR